MLDFQEKFVLKSMIQNNGKSNLQIITDEYKQTITLDFNDILNEDNKLPRWMNSIRKAHQSLKDKNYISGFELGEWSLTPEGYQVARSLLNSKVEINNIILYANEDINKEVLSKHVITFETLYPLDNSITDFITYPVQGILVIEAKKRLEIIITKLELLNPYIYLEISVEEVTDESFDSTKITEGSLEVYLNNVIHLLPVGLSSEDEEPPHTLVSTVVRRIRDTPLSQRLKQAYNHHCQICGETIITGVDRYYSEAHHLKPLGKPHYGPDIESNLIVLCPNHHAEFDGRSISINPQTLLIEHIDKNNQYVNNPLRLSLHKIELKFIIYHYELFRLNLL